MNNNLLKIKNLLESDNFSTEARKVVADLLKKLRNSHNDTVKSLKNELDLSKIKLTGIENIDLKIKKSAEDMLRISIDGENQRYKDSIESIKKLLK